MKIVPSFVPSDSPIDDDANISQICQELVDTLKYHGKEKNPMRAMFDSIDETGDGLIDMAELRNAFKENGITDEEFKQLWDSFMECDFNGILQHVFT